MPFRYLQNQMQILQVLFRVFNAIRLRGVYVSERLLAKVISQVLGISKIPCFKMPLRVRILNAYCSRAPQSFRKLPPEWLQYLLWLLTVKVYENNYLVRWVTLVEQRFY